jgi:hypothetical protein
LKPTPLRSTLHLRAWVTKIDGDRVSVEGSVEAEGIQTVSMRGLFVAVKGGHPAFDKWS